MCHPSLVWYLSECSCSPGQALCCICSNNPLLWWLIMWSVGKRHVRGRMCCFSNHLFSLWLTQWHAGKMNSWPTCPGKTEQHIYLGHFKAKEIIYFTAWKAPENKCFFQTCQTYNEMLLKNSCHFLFLLGFLCAFLFYVLFSLWQSYLQYCHYIWWLYELNIGKP